MSNPNDIARVGPVSTGSVTIRVRRQKGPGYWATIHRPGQPTQPVQSPQIYGFETPAEARAAARHEINTPPNTKV